MCSSIFMQDLSLGFEILMNRGYIVLIFADTVINVLLYLLLLHLSDRGQS